MDNRLVQYANGQTLPTRRDREIARRSKQVYDEVRITGLKADGALALAARIMDGVAELDAKRQSMGTDNMALAALLVDIEQTAIRQVKRQQADLYNNWSL